MVHPGGPSSQRRTSSGLVNASNTSRRGASKSRVTWISRSLGVDTLKVSGKNMEPPLPLLGSGTFMFLFRGFQLAQQAVEAGGGGFPQFAGPPPPPRCVNEGAGPELARAALCVAAPRGQTRAGERLALP